MLPPLGSPALIEEASLVLGGYAMEKPWPPAAMDLSFAWLSDDAVPLGSALQSSCTPCTQANAESLPATPQCAICVTHMHMATWGDMTESRPTHSSKHALRTILEGPLRKERNRNIGIFMTCLSFAWSLDEIPARLSNASNKVPNFYQIHFRQVDMTAARLTLKYKTEEIPQPASSHA